MYPTQKQTGREDRLGSFAISVASFSSTVCMSWVTGGSSSGRMGKRPRGRAGEKKPLCQEQCQLMKSLLHVGSVVGFPTALHGTHSQLSNTPGLRE